MRPAQIAGILQRMSPRGRPILSNPRNAWMIESRLTGRSSETLALLPGGTSKPAIEAALRATYQALALKDVTDRLDVAAGVSALRIDWNASGRLAAAEVNGVGEIIAVKVRVKLVGDDVEVQPQPWSPGTSASKFAAKRREIEGVGATDE